MLISLINKAACFNKSWLSSGDPVSYRVEEYFWCVFGSEGDATYNHM